MDDVPTKPVPDETSAAAADSPAAAAAGAAGAAELAKRTGIS